MELPCSLQLNLMEVTATAKNYQALYEEIIHDTKKLDPEVLLIL